jgi:MATE family multidrug resistance protein
MNSAVEKEAGSRPIWVELRQLLLLAVPLSIAQGGQALMGLVDTAVVARLNNVALAGVGVGNSVFFAVAILGVGVVMGADPLVSQAIGAKNPAAARNWMWSAFWTAVAIAVALVPVVALLPWLLGFIQIPHDVLAQTRAFVLWRIPGLFPFLIFFAQRAYVQAIGRARVLVSVVVLANLLNLVLDVLLVFGGAAFPRVGSLLSFIPALGVRGAALSTNICSLGQVIYLGWEIAKVQPASAPERRPRFGAVRAVSAVGGPVGFHLFMECAVFTLAGVLAARMGAVAGAAHQIALSFCSISFTLAVGIGSAASVRVGYAVGAGDAAAARRAGLTAFGAGAAFMSACAITLAIFPLQLARWMTGDASVLALVVPVLMPAAVFQISDGTQGIGAGVLRGAGDSRFALLANLLGHYAVGLPLTLYLGLVLGRGVVGIWWGLCAGLTAVGVLLFARFWLVSGKAIRPLVDALSPGGVAS